MKKILSMLILAITFIVFNFSDIHAEVDKNNILLNEYGPIIQENIKYRRSTPQP